MTIDREIAYQTRNEILQLLTDVEAAAVARDEEARLPVGEEYLDLEHIELGVLQAAPNTPGTHALPRHAVSDETWSKILDVLHSPVEPTRPS